MAGSVIEPPFGTGLHVWHDRPAQRGDAQPYQRRRDRNELRDGVWLAPHRHRAAHRTAVPRGGHAGVLHPTYDGRRYERRARILRRGQDARNDSGRAHHDAVRRADADPGDAAPSAICRVRRLEPPDDHDRRRGNRRRDDGARHQGVLSEHLQRLRHDRGESRAVAASRGRAVASRLVRQADVDHGLPRHRASAARRREARRDRRAQRNRAADRPRSAGDVGILERSGRDGEKTARRLALHGRSRQQR